MRDFYADTYLAPLSLGERRVLDALRNFAGTRPNNGLYVGAIMGDDVSPARVRVMMSRIRRKLAGTGWTISRNEGGAATSTATYQVVQE